MIIDISIAVVYVPNFDTKIHCEADGACWQPELEQNMLRQHMESRFFDTPTDMELLNFTDKLG